MRSILLALICAAPACLALGPGCARRDPPPVSPGPPIAADPHVEVGSMQVECDGLLAALAAYRDCPNLETEDVSDVDAWIERTNRDLAASRKAKPDAGAQQAIADACRKASDSVKAASMRCAVGPRPKQ